MSTYDIRLACLDNENFRQVLETGAASQLVVMRLRLGEEIGEEVHDDADQTLVVIDGDAEVVLDGTSHILGPDGLAFVHAGTRHNVINLTPGDLRLYSLYAPPEHPPGTVHRTKAEADAAEHDH
jgi:mannose-6-phosphate isomerase-like protein (cupin superfamily)